MPLFYILYYYVHCLLMSEVHLALAIKVKGNSRSTNNMKYSFEFESKATKMCRTP